MNDATINKIDDSTMEVIKDAPVVEKTTTTYNIDFLKQQELDILKSMNDFIKARQKELEEVRNLIGEADNLGLKTSEQIQSEQVIVEQEKLDSSLLENPIK